MVALYLNVSLLKSNLWRKVNNKQPQTLFLTHSLDSVLSTGTCMRGKYLEDLPPITRESSPAQVSVTKVIFQTQDHGPISMEPASYIKTYNAQLGLPMQLFKSTLHVL